ncbi:tRNA (adenosine(37)-N6)-threonylcarbamoyltransferase complex ATPase subunit type 1 TsaE [Pseudomaricurvus sp.]|uniref:tRNA (adenosine(37)-N6)-threonylcarbamoyltransferase complex ATPase subunit type 1 TsaE n=1 Tax=Pseudomaricurvus sp. TaxID=2004510 RepID=UPI003F6D91C5
MALENLLAEHFLADEAATVAAGQAVGLAAEQGAVIFLQGDLGAGKTTFSRGVLRAFGHSGAVKSPTYTLVEPYDFGSRQVYHFDLYRLGDPEELEYMGIRDYFTEQALCLVEWPSRGEGFLPAADVLVTLEVEAPGRRIRIQTNTERGQALVGNIAWGG